jgi:hypothetical protein
MECHTWCLRARLTIEPDKTELIFFSHAQPNLTLHGPHLLTVFLPDWEHSTYYTVMASDHVHYLGLHFNHKLSWDKHISVIVARTKGMLKALQLLGNSVWGLNHGSWCLVYNAICIPALTYGSPIWFKDQKKQTKALQMVQNMAIQVITGAFCSTPLEPLHQLMAIPPMQVQLQQITTQAAIHLLSLPTSSTVLLRLGAPWSTMEGSSIPLPYPSVAMARTFGSNISLLTT